MLALLLTALWCGGICAQSVRDTLQTDTLMVADSVLVKHMPAIDDSLTIPHALADSLARLNEERMARLAVPLDTTIVDSLLKSGLKIKKDKSLFRPDPIRSMWLALVFPGGGQIYNRKLWKLPIVYGGFLGCTYALSWNNQMLRDYSQAYIDIMDDDPNTKSYENMLPMGYDITGKEDRFKTIFKNKKDHFRKYRDMSIFAFAGVYLISVIDAYVDAELSSFDISEDLSIRFEPAVIETGLPTQRHLKQNAYGLSCNIYF